MRLLGRTPSECTGLSCHGRRGLSPMALCGRIALVCYRHRTNSTAGLAQCVKRFPLQQFVSEQYKRISRWCHSPSGEQWLDKQRLHTNSLRPLPHTLGRERLRESLRIFSGTPLQMNRSLSRSRTSSHVSLVATRIARHSRVNSSTKCQHPRIGLPSEQVTYAKRLACGEQS